MRSIRLAIPAALLLIGTSLPLAAQRVIDIGPETTVTYYEGWDGFTNVAFLFSSLLTLILSTVLGAIIGYHPRTMALADTLVEVEAPKVYILCSVIGAIIGILVLKYGLVVGFVMFGIGGLMRFRMVLGSANLTGNVILATLIGLSCGLNLPHIAVLATVFSFILTFILNARPTYSLTVKGLDSGNMIEAAEAYRHLLDQTRCKLIREQKNLNKGTLTLIFRGNRHHPRESIEEKILAELPEDYRRVVDWLVE